MTKKLKKTFIFLILTIILTTYISPVFAADSEDIAQPEITSGAAILMDSYTGCTLYEKNSEEILYPASITKIMTAILAIENCELTDKVTASYDAIMSIPSGYSIGAIQVGETLTVQELLEVLLVHSANDAANVLGEHVGGSIESFASIMNTKAIEIGCTNTHFVNPSGKHDPEHYSTAKDIALIMKYCMQNSTFRKIAGLRSCTISPLATGEQRSFNTTVELLNPNNTNYYYQYAIAGKTGYTTEAKNCVVSVSNKNGFELICVVLYSDHTPEGLSYRFLESKEIYDYGYNNFEIRQIKAKDDIAEQISITNGSEETKNLDALIAENISVLIPQNIETNNLKPTITINDNLQAPITEGQQIGTITYKIQGVSYTSKLLASHSVEEYQIDTTALKIGAFTLLILVVIVIILLIISKNKKN